MNSAVDRLLQLHSEGHRSQHWFDHKKKGTDRYITFMLYPKGHQSPSIGGTGSTFMKAINAAINHWDDLKV